MSTTSTPPSRGKLPLVVFVLAMGTFLMGTTEFVVAGILPEVAGDLQVTTSQAGLFVTIFAIGMIVGAPTMAVLTRNLPSRLTLVLALVVFAAGHLVIALTSVFAIALAARFVAAVATGAFWSVSMLVATRAAGPGAKARAVGIVIAGGTVANVVGVPLGAFVAEIAGWRAPFWTLTVLALVASVVVARLVPSDSGRHEATSLREELRGLRSVPMVLAMLGSATIMGGVLATYTYISPLLIDRAAMPADLMPVVLIAFGAGTLIGVTVGGRLGDAHPYRTTIVAAVATTLLLAALIAFSESAVAAVILISLAGLTGFTVNPITVSLGVAFGHRAPNLAPALGTSAFNVGIAAGSAMAGVALDSSLGDLGPVTVGVVLTAGTIVVLSTLAVVVRHRAADAPRGGDRAVAGEISRQSVRL